MNMLFRSRHTEDFSKELYNATLPTQERDEIEASRRHGMNDSKGTENANYLALICWYDDSIL